MDEIKGMKASDQEKKKMMDILDQYNRYDENEEEDDDETEEEENGWLFKDIYIQLNFIKK